MRKRYLVAVSFMCLLLSGCGDKNNEDKDIGVTQWQTVESTEVSEISTTEEVSSDGSNNESISTEVESTESETKEVETTEDYSEPTNYNSSITVTETEVEEAKNDVSTSFVKDLLTVLMTSYDKDTIDNYLSGIATVDGFEFKPIVDKSTSIEIEAIGVNKDNSNEYLAIVTLRQRGGNSKFAVSVYFSNDKLESISYKKFNNFLS